MRFVFVLAACALIGLETAEAQEAGKPAPAATAVKKKPAPASDVPNPDPLPKNYRAQIVEYVKTIYVDPNGIREAAIAKPFYGTPRLNFYDGPRAFVCVRANMKLNGGAYSGLQTTAYAFHGGKIIDMQTGTMGRVMCRAPVPYQPFPELEKIRK